MASPSWVCFMHPTLPGLQQGSPGIEPLFCWSNCFRHLLSPGPYLPQCLAFKISPRRGKEAAELKQQQRQRQHLLTKFTVGKVKNKYVGILKTKIS